jgi:ribosomal subunit interface protein
MALPWNIVIKNVSPNDARIPLEKKIRQKIAKFERFLKHFPPDAVHLQIVLERHPRKDLYTASLTLRVPSDILHTQESGRDLVGAIDDAVKTLLRELETYKSDLRGEESWKRKGRRQKLRQLKATGFATEPQAQGEGPQEYEDMVRELFQRHYKELLRHARRHILHDELAGDLPKDKVSARDVLNEVERRATAKAEEGPKRGSWLEWFYHLIHEELKRQRLLLGQSKRNSRSIDQGQGPTQKTGTSGAQPRASSVPRDSYSLPDESVARKDVVAQVEHDVRNWPRPEREVFELYYVEGLEPEGIAMVTQRSPTAVRENLASIQRRLREGILNREAVA